jgi:acetolactate synthase-1/2/3 large subunit
MKRSGAWLCAYGLEQLPVTHTFGIPGLQNTEVYDALAGSEKITPVLVTHEGGGAFMADGVSRTSDGIGVLLVVPSAGVTHAMSGIAEAYLDGIPLLIVTGGIRRETDKQYQLHQMDQHRLLEPVTKKTFLPRTHGEIVPALFEAYRTAVFGEPGPVMVEIPVDLQMSLGEIDALPAFTPLTVESFHDPDGIRAAADLLAAARSPGLFLGWGCRDCTDAAVTLAETLAAPAATTLQGLSVFPGNHPLHTGMGFGRSAVPAAQAAFYGCDCLLAVGTRFGEIPTGSYGVKVPENLIHADINPSVFNKNYPAKICLEGDAGEILSALLAQLAENGFRSERSFEAVAANIQREKDRYLEEWQAHATDRVNPARFFQRLRKTLAEDAIVAADDGNHTFLAAELFPVYRSRHFICPTDFNCMGYAIPAAIGAKLANPRKQVAAIVGDGAFLMTGMELLTAATLNAGVVVFVFHDCELAQIAQGQTIPFNRKTCSVLGDIHPEGVARATGAGFLSLPDDSAVDAVIPEALAMAAKGQPVIVDVAIDYSRRTQFTKGAVKTVMKRMPLGDKFRFVGRALARRVTG